jgi:PhoPQ-activated pathogenicity-related protein
MKTKKQFRPGMLAVAIAVLCSISFPVPNSIAAEKASQELGNTALDDYVHAPDTNYSFHLVTRILAKDYTVFILEMTSQAWLTTNEVDRPLWKHWLTILEPKEITASKSLLFIAGGGNGGEPPTSVDANLSRIALATKSVVCELRMIPNQPLVFAGETQGRKEDALIAYTWDKFLRTGDSKWPARLPMTKAAVRAMDTITTFCASDDGGHLKIDGFVVSGGSKRGWTTWTTAAVDKRVVAIVPFVIDVLNVGPSLAHHYGAYGFWAPSIGDYTKFHIMDWAGTPQNDALLKIEDPYSYRSRLTMPKFIVNAGGDQFFVPGSSQFYFNDLPGTKYLRYVPNADHSLRGSDAYKTLQACYSAILNKLHLPEFSWTREGENTLKVTAKDHPSEVKLWQATNPKARDFRLEMLGPAWQSAPLTAKSEGTYLGEVPKPETGWTAFFVELTFPSANQDEFKFTTEVRVVPDVLPHKFVPKGPPK